MFWCICTCVCPEIVLVLVGLRVVPDSCHCHDNGRQKLECFCAPLQELINQLLMKLFREEVLRRGLGCGSAGAVWPVAVGSASVTVPRWNPAVTTLRHLPRAAGPRPVSHRDLGMVGQGMEAPGSTQGPKADLSQRSQELRVLVGLQGAASGCSGTGGSQPPRPTRYHWLPDVPQSKAGRFSLSPARKSSVRTGSCSPACRQLCRRIPIS